MAVAVGVRGRYELPPCSGPGWLLSLSTLLSVAARGAFATTHWVVTEDGKIQQQVAAGASLFARARPRPGGIPLLGPWLLGSARPRPQPTFTLWWHRDPGLPAFGLGTSRSPLVSWSSFGRLEVLTLPPRGSRAAWGRVAQLRGTGPTDRFLARGLEIADFRIPAFGASRTHASPALPEEIESRWQRQGVRESQGV